MQPAPEIATARGALLRLIARYRRQERRMAARLTAGHAELASVQAAAAWSDDESAATRAVLRARCEALQRSCDELAVDLSHLRLALLGAREEWARHGAERPLATAG
jgi:hypothetical protein